MCEQCGQVLFAWENAAPARCRIWILYSPVSTRLICVDIVGLITRSCDASGPNNQVGSYEVSICARPCGRAMPDMEQLVGYVQSFQSTPDREAGRCSSSSARVAMPLAFQSTPDREAGRCLASTSICVTSALFQSTPDREAGRCRDSGASPQRDRRFNPRPTVRPGDACRSCLR